MGQVRPSDIELQETNRLDGLERRSLPFSSVLSLSLAGAIPAAMALTLPAFLTRTVGPGAWVSVVLAGSLMWLINLSLNQFSVRIATSGSLFTFVAQGLGPAAALVSGIAMLIGYGTFASYGLAQAGDFVGRLTQGSDARPADASVSLTVISVVVFAIVCIGLIVVGMRVAGRVTLTVEALTIFILLVVLVWSLIEAGGLNTEALSLENADPGRILLGAVGSLTFFFCFEAATALGTETAQPFKSIPRATSWTVVLMVGLSLLSTILAPAQPPLRAHGSEAFWFPGGGHDGVGQAMLVLRLMCDVASVLAVWTVLTRLVMLWARSGLLPAFVGHTHPAWRTPVAALAVTAPFVVGPAIIFTSASGDVAWAEHQILAASDVCFLLFYLLTCVAAIRFLHRLGESLPSTTAVSAVAAVALAMALAHTLVQEDSDGNVTGLVTLIVVAGIAAGWSLIVFRRGPNGLDLVGIHDSTVVSDVAPQEAYGQP